MSSPVFRSTLLESPLIEEPTVRKGRVTVGELDVLEWDGCTLQMGGPLVNDKKFEALYSDMFPRRTIKYPLKILLEIYSGHFVEAEESQLQQESGSGA
jgi:hypothetical protein